MNDTPKFIITLTNAAFLSASQKTLTLEPDKRHTWCYESKSCCGACRLRLGVSVLNPGTRMSLFACLVASFRKQQFPLGHQCGRP